MVGEEAGLPSELELTGSFAVVTILKPRYVVK
jgi:hypothetical protein